MMEQLPDAPYIQEAERYGLPPYDEPPKCPCCGENANTIYMDQYGNVFACDMCLREQDAYDWEMEEREMSRPDG